jgi:hypothetical protein
MFADLDESATQFAVILTDAGLGGVVGAVYKAASELVTVIVPIVEFPFGTPLTAQLTFVSGCPALVTAAKSWTIPPGKTDDIPEGFVATVTPMSLVIIRSALPLAELFAWLVAWIVTLAGFGKSWGAVYSPVLDIVPTVEFPPEAPFTLQVTAVFDVPVTAAVNCCVLPSNTLELADETITVTDSGGGGAE